MQLYARFDLVSSNSPLLQGTTVRKNLASQKHRKRRWKAANKFEALFSLGESRQCLCVYLEVLVVLLWDNGGGRAVKTTSLVLFKILGGGPLPPPLLARRRRKSTEHTTFPHSVKPFTRYLFKQREKTELFLQKVLDTLFFLLSMNFL